MTQTVTSFTLDSSNSTPAPGDVIQLNPKLTATINPTGTPVQVAPNTATYTVRAKRGENAIALNVNTFVDDQARLHIQRDELQNGDIIAVEGTATYVNPNGATDTYTSTVRLTVKIPVNSE